jgi:hypothetical protein
MTPLKVQDIQAHHWNHGIEGQSPCPCRVASEPLEFSAFASTKRYPAEAYQYLVCVQRPRRLARIARISVPLQLRRHFHSNRKTTVSDASLLDFHNQHASSSHVLTHKPHPSPLVFTAFLPVGEGLVSRARVYHDRS